MGWLGNGGEAFTPGILAELESPAPVAHTRPGLPHAPSSQCLSARHPASHTRPGQKLYFPSLHLGCQKVSANQRLLCALIGAGLQRTSFVLVRVANL